MIGESGVVSTGAANCMWANSKPSQ